jgi:hypothetical protein
MNAFFKRDYVLRWRKIGIILGQCEPKLNGDTVPQIQNIIEIYSLVSEMKYADANIIVIVVVVVVVIIIIIIIISLNDKFKLSELFSIGIFHLGGGV